MTSSQSLSLRGLWALAFAIAVGAGVLASACGGTSRTVPSDAEIERAIERQTKLHVNTVEQCTDNIRGLLAAEYVCIVKFTPNDCHTWIARVVDGVLRVRPAPRRVGLWVSCGALKPISGSPVP